MRAQYDIRAYPAQTPQFWGQIRSQTLATRRCWSFDGPIHMALSQCVADEGLSEMPSGGCSNHWTDPRLINLCGF